MENTDLGAVWLTLKLASVVTVLLLLIGGLGLRKIRSTSELVDTPEVRGMINKISYLVKVL